MELWRSLLKTIEGNFGTGIVAYFIFLRWLMLLNLLVFLLILIFIILPQILLHESNNKLCDLSNTSTTDVLSSLTYSNTSISIECCYQEYINETNKGNHFSVLDLFKGTGFMEKTILFYGMYSNQIFGYDPFTSSSSSYSTSSSSNNINYNQVNYNISSSNIENEQQNYELYYNLPLAYIIIHVLYYIISLFAILRTVAKDFKERMVEGEGQYYKYCNLIFGSWDFCIHNEKSAQIKHKAILNEITSLINIKKFEYDRLNRSNDLICKLIFVRIFINIIVLLILLSTGYVIYLLFNLSLSYLNPNYSDKLVSFIPFEEHINEDLIILFYEFLPYFIIVLFNLIIPILFNYLVQFEKYSSFFVIQITLLRTIFLRLSSLGVLLSRFYYLIDSHNSVGDLDCYNKQSNINGMPQCWETFVGQQFFKLFIMDFVINIFVTFFINFPRSILAKQCLNSKFAKLIGEQEFELSREVLDIVYLQTLCWLGSFYSPFLSAISAVILFIMFYIKKFSCLINSRPPTTLYRVSRARTLFLFVLLISFIGSIIPITYAIFMVKPSYSCGPFRGQQTVWVTLNNTFMKTPNFIKSLIFFIGTPIFLVPCFILIVILLYYYYSVSVANKQFVQVLKNQLVLEGHDKQFLLSRLSMFIKQQQEYQKRIRQIDSNMQQQQQQRSDRE